ncbi:MAG: outer membrane beta-barrel protein [Brumimicrobium sp.]|nr:outer membrane beta-barrel protein [Brumimicrobium sp.]
MKTQLFLAATLISSLTLNAQEEKTQDTTRISYKGKVITVHTDDDTLEVKKQDKWEVNHWRGFEFGMNGYSTGQGFEINNDPNNTYLELDYGKSFMLGFNFAEFNYALGTEKFRLMTGLGLRFNRYAFKSTNSTLSYNDTTIFRSIDSVKTIDKNYLNTTYLSAPLFLTLMPGKDPEKSFHLSLGAIVSYRIGSRVKQKYTIDEQKRKDIVKGHYHINPFLVDASVRMGVGDFTIYANYGLTSLFESGKGPEYYPFSAGLCWNF